MNLVEQLGGYECAKAEYDDPMYEDGELYTIKATGVRFFKHNLADELLQYRRQHNIFEVDDKVVFIHPFELGDLFTVHSISERFIGVESNNGECIYYAEIVWGLKHTTDEEIKAGKRLEVNQ